MNTGSEFEQIVNPNFETLCTENIYMSKYSCVCFLYQKLVPVKVIHIRC